MPVAPLTCHCRWIRLLQVLFTSCTADLPPTLHTSSLLPPTRRAARALDTLMKELCVPLGAYIKGFPAPARLHPFERALLELTVGAGTYERVLARVEALRRSTVEVRRGESCGAACSRADQAYENTASCWICIRPVCAALRDTLQLPMPSRRGPPCAGGQGVRDARLSCGQQEGRAGAAGGGAGAPASSVQPRQLRRCAGGLRCSCVQLLQADWARQGGRRVVWELSAAS